MFWSYDGPGGAYDYWPDGLDGPMRSERPPFVNSALVADNNRMYHRIGRTGDPAAVPPALPADAQISRRASGGWAISGTSMSPVCYDDSEIRISILWKAQVRPSPENTGPPLGPELITQVISADLARKGLQAPGYVPSLSDRDWLDRLHSASYVPVNVAARSPATSDPAEPGMRAGPRERRTGKSDGAGCLWPCVSAS